MAPTLPDRAAAHASNQSHGATDLAYGPHMSFLDELDELADQVTDDAQELRNRAVKLLESHAREHPERLFKLLRTVKPVLLKNNLAIVTRYHDVVEVLGHDEAFSVQPYREKMMRLAGDFILGTDDSPQYERDISILRLAAPRSDVPALAGFVKETAEALVAGAGGRIDVADLCKRVPARLFGRWFGTPGPDEDTLIAWTLAIFEEIFVNLKNDPAIASEADAASAALAAHLDEAIAARKALAQRHARRRGRPAAGDAGDLGDGVHRRGDPRQRDRARVRLRPHDRDRHHVRARRAARAARGARGRPGGGAGRRRRRGARLHVRGDAARAAGPGPVPPRRARTSRSPRARCTRRRSRRGRSPSPPASRRCSTTTWSTTPTSSGSAARPTTTCTSASGCTSASAASPTRCRSR